MHHVVPYLTLQSPFTGPLYVKYYCINSPICVQTASRIRREFLCSVCEGMTCASRCPLAWEFQRGKKVGVQRKELSRKQCHCRQVWDQVTAHPGVASPASVFLCMRMGLVRTAQRSAAQGMNVFLPHGVRLGRCNDRKHSKSHSSEGHSDQPLIKGSKDRFSRPSVRAENTQHVSCVIFIAWENCTAHIL